ncbi:MULTISPECIES: hypothetical protein [Methanobacterium]|uniref:Uncharacterized protein n=1 Tax=Methanobacterium veterum TaxID=408577 RepID=A0A9E5DGR1_9EURY|nr:MULTISPECIES: hypothetical protein [Methanobacterium]MCZ3364871.1 hypothetical protein [Methanobacterium veterum]MCZ3372626.1 hypothetical protein [Methanobacterium veterum]
MSKFIDSLLKFYNEEKEKESPENYVKSIKKLLDFYGVKTD